jgi:hypothetical protein
MIARMTPVLAVTLFVGACSGIFVNQDYNPGTDFSALRTWDWMPAPSRPTGDRRSQNPEVDMRIRTAVETGLQERGFSRDTTGNPDFRVGYQITLSDRVDFETVNTYWGPGWGYTGVYGAYYGPVMGTSNTYARGYTSGTFVLDFFDVASRELVWRGTAEGNLRDYKTAEEKQERANKVVKRILQQFPPIR